jgi:hypothetical protein
VVIAASGGGGGGGGLFAYQFNNGSPPPTGNQIRLNNSDQTLATEVWIRYETSDGVDIRHVLALIDADDIVAIQDKDNAATFRRYQTIGPAVDQPANQAVMVPVVHLNGNGTLPNQAVELYIGKQEPPPVLALDDLTDVDVTGVVDGQALVYDLASATWKPVTQAGGVTDLDDLTDVDVATTPPTNGQGLVYNGTLWVPANLVGVLDDLTDVQVGGAVVKDSLAFDGSVWKPGPGFTIAATAPSAGDGKDGDWWAVTGEPFVAYPTGIGLTGQSGSTVVSQNAMRAGDVVTVSVQIGGSWTGSINQGVCGIPAPFIPATRIDLAAVAWSASAFFPVRMILQTSGQFQALGAFGATTVTAMGWTVSYRAAGPFP